MNTLLNTPGKKLIAVVVAGVILWALYYALSPLWRTTTVDEGIPGLDDVTVDTSMEEDEHTEFLTDEGPSMNDAMPADDVSSGVAVGEPSPIVDTPIHPASGQARIVKSGGKTFVRFEDFKTINGPDVFIYLANDIDATDYVKIEPLKATEGNVNYEIPANINIEDYQYVLHWCEQFRTLFNYAELNQIEG